MITVIIAAGAGFVVGAFTPAVGRKIKSYFVTESKVAIAAAPASVQTAMSAVEAEAKKL